MVRMRTRQYIKKDIKDTMKELCASYSQCIVYGSLKKKKKSKKTSHVYLYILFGTFKKKIIS